VQSYNVDFRTRTNRAEKKHVIASELSQFQIILQTGPAVYSSLYTIESIGRAFRSICGLYCRNENVMHVIQWITFCIGQSTNVASHPSHGVAPVFGGATAKLG
jgi:hypothetical protein